ncbi:hypothetical protein, partial [Victivallis vadensis]|uniref:hypothetical protein n=1 Tax=Victivallis vadensis TaxID=172901 RepID=UPI00266BA6D8
MKPYWKKRAIPAFALLCAASFAASVPAERLRNVLVAPPGADEVDAELGNLSLAKFRKMPGRLTL